MSTPRGITMECRLLARAAGRSIDRLWHGFCVGSRTHASAFQQLRSRSLRDKQALRRVQKCTNDARSQRQLRRSMVRALNQFLC